MKRGRPKKLKDEEGETEVKKRRIKKLAEQEDEKEEEVVKKKDSKKHKKQDEKIKQSAKDKPKEKKFEIQPLDIGGIFEHIMKSIDKDPSLKSIIRSAHAKYKDIQNEICRRKNAMFRSNFQEREYREEMKKLQVDEKAKMNELYGQTIEKLTAAQIMGFESVEALKKRYKLEMNKEKSKNVIMELLKKKSEEPSELDIDIENSGIVKEQLQKRRSDQQDVLLKVFKSRIELGEEEAHKEQRYEKPKYMVPQFKKAKSIQIDQPIAAFQRSLSCTNFEPKLETVKIEKVALADILKKEEQMITETKLQELQKNIDFYYESSQKAKLISSSLEYNLEPSTIHPSLNEFEVGKVEKFAELEKKIKQAEDISYDDLAFLIYVTEECTNKLNQFRVTKVGDLKSLDIKPAEIKKFLDRVLLSQHLQTQ